MTTPAHGLITLLRRGAADARTRWIAEAERLDLWAAGTDAQLNQETTATALARFRAAVLRLGAAMLGAKP